MEHVETGLIGGKPGPLDLHAAEGPNGNVSVGIPAPRTTPVFQLDHLGRRFLDEKLDGILVGQPVGAGDGVLGVVVEAVVRLDHRGRPTFGRDGMAAHRINLGDDPHAQRGILLADSDGGTQARTTTPNDENIVTQEVHVDRIRSTGADAPRSPYLFSSITFFNSAGISRIGSKRNFIEPSSPRKIIVLALPNSPSFLAGKSLRNCAPRLSFRCKPARVTASATLKRLGKSMAVCQPGLYSRLPSTLARLARSLSFWISSSALSISLSVRTM